MAIPDAPEFLRGKWTDAVGLQNDEAVPIGQGHGKIPKRSFISSERTHGSPGISVTYL
jgi:hypothetical protein